MNTRLLALISTTILLLSCGESTQTETARELITWNAGDSDPFGCTYRVPEPWVSEEVHEGECSDGCSPLRVDDMFAACVAIPGYPPEVVLDEGVCLTHPVTRTAFGFSNSGGGAMQQVCWGPCEEVEGLVTAPVGALIPDECYEEPE